MRAHPDQHYGCLTYAQHGEDIVLLNIFALLGIERGGYLDIGAHHPSDISNTKLLYDRGWRGVNVDANPYVMHEFMKERPEDKNLCMAVTGKNETVTRLYLYSRTSGRNSVDPAEVARMEDWASPRESIEVPAVSIDGLSRTYFAGAWPDLLSMDIEGLDYEVLGDASFATFLKGPRVVCVEVRRTRSEQKKFVDLMIGRSYGLYGRFGENLIFVRSDCMRVLFGELYE